MSPVMAAAAAIVGKLADVRKLTDDATPLKASPKLEISEHVDDVSDAEDLDRIMDIPHDSNGGTNEHALPAKGSTGLPKFTIWKGIAAPLDRSNVDTDAIIPKQFLKTIKRTGLGNALFHPLRYNEDGSENPDFVLNKEPYRKAKILVVTGPNFGCGSSREHAPWALLDFGIKAVVAPSYADIFSNNLTKNGMIPIVVSDEAKLTAIADKARAGEEIEIDLPNQTVKDASGNELAKFDVDEFRKHCLVEGLDDIGLTMQMDEKISKFEDRRTLDTPWLDGSGYLAKWRKAGKTNAPGQPVKVEAVPVPKTNRGQELTDPNDW